MWPRSHCLSSIHPITILQQLWLRPSKFLEPAMGTDSFSICAPQVTMLSCGFCTRTQEGWGKEGQHLPDASLIPATCILRDQQRSQHLEDPLHCQHKTEFHHLQQRTEEFGFLSLHYHKKLIFPSNFQKLWASWSCSKPVILIKNWSQISKNTTGLQILAVCLRDWKGGDTIIPILNFWRRWENDELKQLYEFAEELKMKDMGSKSFKLQKHTYVGCKATKWTTFW